ncbi:MAG: hypothetical protein GY895_00970 [Phycisphaera sp.]|nr:hypothetical protein [Phycisphaera sp.]
MIHQEPSNLPTRPIRLLLAAIVAGGLLAASPTPPRTGLPVASPTEVALMVAEAERLMNAGTWAEAARAWSQVETADPSLAEAAYNRGVAEYRAGELAAAAEAFRRAAEVGDADLAAQAMYNEGTARYADAVKRLSTEAGDATPSPSPSPPGDTETPSDPLEDAMERVELSLDHFRDAIDADPGNRDARANAELAHRLLQRLQEIKEQSQDEEQQGEQSQDEQQQGEQSQDEQQQGDQSQDEQQQGEQSQDEQQQGEQSQDEQQQGEQSQDEQQQGEQSQDEQQQGEQSQDEQQQGEQSQDEQQQGEQSQDQSSDDDGETGETASEDGRMSREEAERLLQSVRDKERQRRRARAEAESETEDRRPPARKDW